MRRFTITACAAILLALAAQAQSPDSATQMKNWMDYMTPGKEHAMMAAWSGTWNGDVKLWMTPGTPAMTSTETCVNTMVLGGRYQQSSHQGSFMGQPFEGMSSLAFDNAKKVFISTWIDNMGTGMMIGTGKWNTATNSVTLTGKMVDPSTRKEVAFREVFKVIDEDHQVMQMFAPAPGGKEFMTMEIKFTRQK
jgi:hypothetical protein